MTTPCGRQFQRADSHAKGSRRSVRWNACGWFQTALRQRPRRGSSRRMWRCRFPYRSSNWQPPVPEIGMQGRYPSRRWPGSAHIPRQTHRHHRAKAKIQSSYRHLRTGGGQKLNVKSIRGRNVPRLGTLWDIRGSDRFTLIYSQKSRESAGQSPSRTPEKGYDIGMGARRADSIAYQEIRNRLPRISLR